jgi:hypothetical protein
VKGTIVGRRSAAVDAAVGGSHRADDGDERTGDRAATLGGLFVGSCDRRE